MEQVGSKNRLRTYINDTMPGMCVYGENIKGNATKDFVSIHVGVGIYRDFTEYTVMVLSLVSF